MKTINEIYGEMLASFSSHTGLDGGSGGDLAVRFYALAAQIQALYLQAEWTQRQCFPQTAAGEYLDYHATLRGIERKKAAKAAGTLRFSVENAVGFDLHIPVGTVCMTAGLVRFVTTEEATLAAGEFSVDVPAEAAEAGAAGNAAAHTVVRMSVAPTGVAACTNPAAFAGGADDEGDDSLRERVLATYRRLANGANAAYYHQQAMSFDEVAAAAVLPRARGVGTVDVVIAGRSGLPDEDLLARVQDHFNSTREIAVDVKVKGPETVPVNVVVSVKTADNRETETVLETVRSGITAWFSGERLGQDVLLAALGAQVYGVEGVENYAFAAPAADVAVPAGALPVLGALTVEAMS